MADNTRAAFTYRHTRWACNLGTICLAANNNLLPLLFIIFQDSYGISYERLGRLILLNFLTQLVTDIIAARYADKIGHRAAMILAHALCAAGLIFISAASLLPFGIYGALALGTIISSIGSGLLEVLVSPISDALPAEKESKAANMALLHSFYCWGQVLVVVVTTFLLLLVGHERWRLLPLVWIILPVTALFLFAKVPLVTSHEPANASGIKKLFASRVFWASMLLMLCSGASEITVSQWSSMFAEQSLGITKVLGDLIGPCMFAVMMGIGRTFYGVWGNKIRLAPFIAASAFLCVISYLMISLSTRPAVSLAGVLLCGFSVSIMWPGTLSLNAARFPLGGTAMFGILAMSGDLGAAAGPWLAGFSAERASKGAGVLNNLNLISPLHFGILIGIIFPFLMLAVIVAARKSYSVK